MRIFRSIMILLAMMTMLVYIVYAFVFFSEKMEMKECHSLQIEVKDSLLHQFVSSQEIHTLFRKELLNLVGKKLSEIDTEEMEYLIQKNKAVRRVKCYKTPSGSLHISIYQREPLFRVMGEEDYYVDTKGVRIPVLSQSAIYLPIVTGRVTVTNVKEIYNFVVFLQSDKFWLSQIEQIHVMENGQIELTPRVGDHHILLGTLDGYEQKLQKMKRLYEKGLDKMDWNRYKMFDLRYRNQVVGTKR